MSRILWKRKNENAEFNHRGHREKILQIFKKLCETRGWNFPKRISPCQKKFSVFSVVGI
jgi:hypothetical protein